MDDLAGMLNNLISDPAGMEKIKNLAEMFGLSAGQSVPPVSSPAPLQNDDVMKTVMNLAPLLGGLHKDDETTHFLYALRPLLSEGRQKKLDESMKILKLLRLLPLIKDTGLLSSIF